MDSMAILKMVAEQPGKLKASDRIDHQTGTTALGIIAASAYTDEFLAGLGLFIKQSNSHEIVYIEQWYRSFVYVGVRDIRWKHYPCGHRALVSFDWANGQWASYQSDNRYAYARKGWGRFMDDLVGYSVKRYSDCGDRDKTTFC